MLIYTVTEHDFDCFKSFFHKHRVEVLPKKYGKEVADLIVFAGGSDVHPSWYGGQTFGNWYDKKRDEWELQVLRDIRTEELKASKVLGICRGIQLLNVGFGGTLVYDIYSLFGREHPYHHEITWTAENILSFLTRVNSLHHQAISSVGDGARYSVLGYEPNSHLMEAVIWQDKFLGLQFHPEYWKNSVEADKMADALADWATRKVTISGRIVAERY